MLLGEAIARYLETYGLVSFDPTGNGGDTFLDRMPAQPDEAVAITVYGGERPETRYGYDSPSLQLRVRSVRYDPRPGRLRAERIYSQLQDLHGLVLPGGTWLLRCSAVQSAPTPIGADENDRQEYTLNFDLHTRNVTAHRI